MTRALKMTTTNITYIVFRQEVRGYSKAVRCLDVFDILSIFFEFEIKTAKDKQHKNKMHTVFISENIKLKAFYLGIGLLYLSTISNLFSLKYRFKLRICVI